MGKTKDLRDFLEARYENITRAIQDLDDDNYEIQVYYEGVLDGIDVALDFIGRTK